MTEPKPKRAAIYPRVSTGGQEQDGTSLGTQEDLCRAHAVERGYIVEDAHVYREVHTGTELWERTELTRMRAAIRSREVDVVIAYAIDRLSRDPVHLGVIVSEAEHAGVNVEFVTEPLDNSPEGQLIRFVRGYAAKIEHEKIRERSIRGKRARAEQGRLLPSDRPLYGYQWCDATKSAYTPDPVTAPVVQRIFREMVNGGTLRGLAMALTAEGIPTPKRLSHNAWCYQTVRFIVTNPAYCGRAVAWRYAHVRPEKSRSGHTGRTPVIRPVSEQVSLPDGVVPPLVTAETFEAVQTRLSLNRARSARNNRHPEAALLRGGFVRCGYCGNVMRLQTKGTDGLPKQYRCGRLGGGAGGQRCFGHGISILELDTAVWQRVEMVLTQPEIIASEIEQMQANDPTVTDLDTVDKSLATIARQQANLVDQLANVGGAVADLVTGKLHALETQRVQLIAERDAILGHHQAWVSARESLTQLEQWCRTVATNLHRFTYDDKRLALDALQVQARVWKKDHTPRYDISAFPLGNTIVSIPSSRSSPTPAAGWWTRATALTRETAIAAG